MKIQREESVDPSGTKWVEIFYGKAPHWGLSISFKDGKFYELETSHLCVSSPADAFRFAEDVIEMFKWAVVVMSYGSDSVFAHKTLKEIQQIKKTEVTGEQNHDGEVRSEGNTEGKGSSEDGKMPELQEGPNQ